MGASHPGARHPSGGISPARALALLPLATGAGLLAHVVAGLSLPAGVALAGAAGFGVAVFVWRRTPTIHRRAVLRPALRGALAAAVSTAAYDGRRLVVVALVPTAFGPFAVLPVFGQLLIGSGAPPFLRTGVGLAYHLCNGVGFGTAFVFLFPRPNLWRGWLWAACLELCM